MPFCPTCREEFRDGFTVCSDCGAALVPALPSDAEAPLPEGEGGSHGGWDQVAETGQVYEAELMAMRLRGAGIEAQVVDQTFHQEPLPDVRSFAVVRVLVPEDRAQEAREILATSVALPEDGESTPESTPPGEDDSEPR